MRTLCLLLACLLALPLLAAPATESGYLPQGFAVGDVKADSAVFWTRLPSGHGRLELRENDRAIRQIELAAKAEDDFTVQVRLDGLRSHQQYGLRLVALDAAGKELETREGSLRTALASGERGNITFLMSGDLGGQGYCRHPDKGYAIFDAMRELDADFFVANGDMIYADSICPPANNDGKPNLVSNYLDVSSPELDWRDSARTFEAFAGHWRYNRADGPYQAFLAQTPIYVQWDDHEVINDFGAAWSEWPVDSGRPGYPNLVAAGSRALFLYNPIGRHPHEPQRIYRSFSRGRDLDLFLIDARSYRSPNDLADRPSNAKTALGKEQLAWLEEGLRRSTATFKVISNDVPLALPTGGQSQYYGRDAFANGSSDDFSKRTGFERELIELLAFLDRENIDNVVFLATDVHFAMELRYEIDADGDGDLLTFHELIAGPLSAVRTTTPFQLDPTFKPTTLFAKGDLFNFLAVHLEIGSDGMPRLQAEIRDEKGQIQEGSRLTIVPTQRDRN